MCMWTLAKRHAYGLMGHVYSRYWRQVDNSNLRPACDYCWMDFQFVSLLSLILNPAWLDYLAIFHLTYLWFTPACLYLLPMFITDFNLESWPWFCLKILHIGSLCLSLTLILLVISCLSAQLLLKSSCDLALLSTGLGEVRMASSAYLTPVLPTSSLCF